MTRRKKILLICLAVPAFLLLGMFALLLLRPSHTAPRYDYDAAAVDYMKKNFSRIERDGKGVRLEADQREVFYYRPWSRPPADASSGQSVVLVPGDYVMRFDHHGSDSFTIRKVLADKVVVEYLYFNSFNGRDEKHTGTVDIAYRAAGAPAGDAPRPAVLQSYEAR